MPTSKSQIQDPNKVLRSILRKPIDAADVYLSSSRTLKIDALNQKVEAINEVTERGLAIRVIKNKKIGFAYTSDLDETVVNDVIDQAIANAAASEPDDNNIFPNHLSTYQPIKLDLYDNIISNTPIQKKIKLALNIESAARDADKRITKTEKITYTEGEESVAIANSYGLNVNYRRNHCGAMAEMIAEANGEMESGSGVSFVKKFADLNAAAIGREAAQRAAEQLGARSIASQSIPLVFDQLSGADLLEVIANLLSADAVQKGKSLFAGKLEQLIASSIVTIIDDGRLANGLASAPFDDEGSMTGEHILIESGKLNKYLHNAYTAKKSGAASTGNASRGSFKVTPGIAPTNLYFKPGVQGPTSIVQGISSGLYVTRLMGLHTANPISGDFSLGAAGVMIENGEKTYPVRGITIAGNLVELLRSIETVGTDLRFVANIGSPTLLINGLSISGQ